MSEEPIITAEVFRKTVLEEVLASLKLNTYTDNYDHETFDALFGEDRSMIFDVKERSFYFDWFYCNYQRLFNVYNLLSNQESRDLYLRLICFRLAGHHSYKINPSYLERIGDLERYESCVRQEPSGLGISGQFGRLKHYNFKFDGLHYRVDCMGLEYYLHRRQYFYESPVGRVIPEPGDVVVDGGACLGDTTAVFSNAVGEKGRVLAFDPIADHIDVIKHNTSQFINENVEVFPYGLSNHVKRTDPLRLDRYNPGFQARDSELPMITLDSLLDDGAISKLDFIKLDVEGSELQALEGAQRVISIFRPKLAISIYHKPNDLFEIMERVRLAFPFYKKFFVEHYSIQMGESVLYASL